MHIRWLVREIRAALKKYRRHWVDAEEEDVEQLLTGDPPLRREAWRRMRGWYRAAVDHAFPPARFTLKRIMPESVGLYRTVPPHWEKKSQHP